MTRFLETCPRGEYFTIGETSSRDLIEQLQQSFNQSEIMLQQTKVFVMERCQQWKLYEDCVQQVTAFIKRLNYAKHKALLKGPVDLPRLETAELSMQVELLFHSFVAVGISS